MRGSTILGVAYLFVALSAYADAPLRQDNYTGDFRDLKRCGEFLTNAAAAASPDPENPYVDLDAVRREINDVYARLPDMNQEALNDPLRCCALIASTRDLSPVTRQHLYRQAALEAQQLPSGGWGNLPWLIAPLALALFFLFKKTRRVQEPQSDRSE